VAGTFRHGFKAEAERIALELRAELGVALEDRLDPLALAKSLHVPVLSLRDLRGANPAAVRHFLSGRGCNDFSAATLYVARFRRIILFNPAHSDGRKMSSLCHEIGHIVLAHESEGPIDAHGVRDWNHEQEREADWLAGCLLIPAQAAIAAARRGLDDRQVMAQFGVSHPMAIMRMNVTAARIIAQRIQAARRPPSRSRPATRRR